MGLGFMGLGFRVWGLGYRPTRPFLRSFERVTPESLGYAHRDVEI